MMHVDTLFAEWLIAHGHGRRVRALVWSPRRGESAGVLHAYFTAHPERL